MWKFTVTSVVGFSGIATLGLCVVLLVSSKLSYTEVASTVGLMYMAVSLVFSITLFMLLLRRYGISPKSDLALRVVAILGAVLVFCVWGALVYPAIVLLS